MCVIVYAIHTLLFQTGWLYCALVMLSICTPICGFIQVSCTYTCAYNWHIHGIFNACGCSRQIVAADARSVWVKVEYRRPFSGCSIGDHAQLSATPIGDHVQLFPDHAQLRPVL